MYRNNKVKIVKLTTGQKTINGAREYIEKNYATIDTKSEIILAVGGNDLINSSVEDTIEKYKAVIELCNQKLPMNKVSILPPLIRLHNREYSRKQKGLLTKLHSEVESERVKIIKNDVITSWETSAYCFTEDGIHLNHDGTLGLVKIFKTHLNTQFGMAPYEEYKQRHNTNGDYDYDYNDDDQFRSFRPQYRNARQKPRYHPMANRFNQRPDFNRPRPRQFGHFDLKSALADIINRM